jgi:YHS domain-containing protein
MKSIIKSVLTAVTVAFLSMSADAAAAKAAKGGVKRYPLKTCIVTDNDLDSMGGERKLVYQGQEVKFCCAPCVKKFNKNPGKYLSKL